MYTTPCSDVEVANGSSANGATACVGGVAVVPGRFKRYYQTGSADATFPTTTKLAGTVDRFAVLTRKGDTVRDQQRKGRGECDRLRKNGNKTQDSKGD